MERIGDRKALTVELFEVTGEAVPESDPIVTGALFFSYKLGESGRLAEEAIREAALIASDEIREAGRLAAQEILAAGRQAASGSGEAVVAAEAATRAAAAAVQKMAADRAQLMRALEAHVAKCVKQASTGLSGPASRRDFPLRYVVGTAFAGAVALAAALAVGIERGSSLAEDAAVGRSFARVVPTMDPKLKHELMEHLRKNPG